MGPPHLRPTVRSDPPFLRQAHARPLMEELEARQRADRAKEQAEGLNSDSEFNFVARTVAGAKVSGESATVGFAVGTSSPQGGLQTPASSAAGMEGAQPERLGEGQMATPPQHPVSRTNPVGLESEPMNELMVVGELPPNDPSLGRKSKRKLDPLDEVGRELVPQDQQKRVRMLSPLLGDDECAELPGAQSELSLFTSEFKSGKSDLIPFLRGSTHLDFSPSLSLPFLHPTTTPPPWRRHPTKMSASAWQRSRLN